MTRSASARSWEEHQPCPCHCHGDICSLTDKFCPDCSAEQTHCPGDQGTHAFRPELLAPAAMANWRSQSQHVLCACLDATARRAVSARSFTHLIPRHDVVFAFTLQVLFDPTTLQG
jgi:hypothetical protein